MLNIKKNISLASYTTFKIGGLAKLFTEVKNKKEIIEALNYAKKNNLKYFILAGGSNILISDGGFNGLVIKLQATRLPDGQASYKLSGYARSGKARQHEKIKAGAGVNLSEVVSKSAETGLSGLEWAAGIPGTVGGAVRGNAGAFGYSMANVVENIEILNTDSLKTEIYNLEKCKFEYRTSAFKQNQNIIILSVTLKLKKDNVEKIQQRVENIISKRKEKQPRFPSAGSFFKNPIIKDEEIIKRFESDTGLKMKDDKIPAGWLIEEADLRGKKIGGAQVNEKHGNFIINTGNATAEDVIMLASIIKQKIRSVFNVQLMEEAQMVGF